MTKVLVLYYSMYGHMETMANAVAEGVRQVDGVNVEIKRVPETMSEEALRQAGAKMNQQAPVASIEELADYDAVIVGSPTRFGNMCGQMRTYFDQTGSHWGNGALIGKVGSAFTSSATQHGGQETTLTSIHTTLLHQGYIVVGVPYSCPGISNMDEITGGSPYGASTLARQDGSRQPSENELEIARFQGKHVAAIAQKQAAR